MKKIDVACTYSRTTTTFENIYPHRNSDLRVHKVHSVAASFSPTDLSGVRARFFHLGPLTTREMSLEFLRAVSAQGDVCLDVQGLVRNLIGNEVKMEAWSDMEEGLDVVSILKANEEEAGCLSTPTEYELVRESAGKRSSSATLHSPPASSQRLEPTSDERYLVSTAHSGNAQRDPARCLARQQTHPEQLPPPSTQNFAQCG